MPFKKSLQLHPVADLTPFLKAGKLVALNVGPDAQVYAVIALKRLDYTISKIGGAIFPQITPDSPQTYQVVALNDGDVSLDVRVTNEPFNIHDIQPLPDDQLLLVCCRSNFNGPDDFDKNGRVYSTKGKFIREILLGDGIQCVQTTLTGMIWTSFFDEGIFGNLGWNNPIGSSGLLAWDSQGNKLYEFHPVDGLDSICDCYALNVESDSNTWFYYYTEFPLVHLRDQQIESHWAIPIDGSSAFAISPGFALFNGGYEKHDDYHLFELGGNGYINQVAKFTLYDENGKRLIADSILGRSNSLYIVRKNKIYRCDVQAVVARYM